MDLLRPCLFFCLLAILLSMSNSSTTNSDPTNTEALQWKGGEGAKKSRVKRQNLNLQHALRLPEKAYAFYMFWRLLDEVYNDTNTIQSLTMRPDELEFTSEGPKNKEIEVKPSSAPIQKQSTHFIGMTSTNDSTVMASFTTETSLLDSQKTTQLQDLQLAEQSTQRLQTTIQKEPNQSIERHIPDSTTAKFPSTAAEEPSSTALHKQIDHFTGINGTNSTSVVSFPTDSLPDLQKTTLSGDSQVAEQTSQHDQTTKLKMSEPSEVIERDIIDSTLFSTSFQSILKPSPPARTKQTTLSTDKPEIIKTPPHTISVTWQNGKSNWPVTATDWSVSKHTPPKLTLKQQIQDFTSLLLTEHSNSALSESTSDPEHHKPKTTEVAVNQHTEKNPKSSEKHTHTASVVRHETEESQSDSINEGPMADSTPKENSTSNDLLTEMDKPTQSMSGQRPSRTTHIAITRTVSRKPKTFILPRHKSANTAIEDKKTRRDIFGLIFTFGCLMLLIIVILLRVIWRRWQARNRGSNMWVAGLPLVWGTYHSLWQNSSLHTAIQMRKEDSQKITHKTIVLKQQDIDLV